MKLSVQTFKEYAAGGLKHAGKKGNKEAMNFFLDVLDLQKENEQLKAQTFSWQQIEEFSQSITEENSRLHKENEQYNTLLNQIHENLCNINKEMDKTMVLPEDYHNPADVEVLRKALNVIKRTLVILKAESEHLYRHVIADAEEALAEIDKAIGGKEDA